MAVRKLRVQVRTVALRRCALAVLLVVVGLLTAEPAVASSAVGYVVAEDRPFQEPSFRLAGADGGVFTFGAGFHGSAAGLPLQAPVVGMGVSRSGAGYWLAAADGGVFTFGDANFFGSLAGMSLQRPIVGMAATASGLGYWLVAGDGGVFAFGDAVFFGSLAGTALHGPIVSITRTPSGSGYWLTGQDGGVFTFGDAPFLGALSDPALLVAALIRIDRSADPGFEFGYVVVQRTGSMHFFTRARRYTADCHAEPVPAPVVGAAYNWGLDGYWLATAAGHISSCDTDNAYGTRLLVRPAAPIVAITPGLEFP